MIEPKKLTNLRVELLKVFSYELPEKNLMEIRQLLAEYFAEKASDEMDRLWDERNWSNETMEVWIK